MELVLQPTIYHDVASSRHADLPHITNGKLQIEEWWPSVWRQVKPPAVKYGISRLDQRAVQSQHTSKIAATVEAFEESAGLCKPEVLSWSDIILENINNGRNVQAVNLYREMWESNVRPDEKIFVPLLKTCSSMEIIEQGKWVHSHILERGLESDPYISCTLIDMYVKCGNLEEAQCAFDSLPVRLVEAWNALIAGYTQNDIGDEGVKLFKQMQWEGIKPSRVTFICVLKACSSIADLVQGRQIHAFLIESGFEFAIFVQNALIDMYVKCASLDDAHAVFGRLSTPDVTACNTLIGGYAQDGSLEQALFLLNHMQEMGIEFDKITFICILKACCIIESLQQGRHIHAKVVECGLELDELVSNSLIHMYMCCESFEDAELLCDKMPRQNVVTWTTLIAGYTQSGQDLDTSELLGKMRQQGIEPNEVTYISILKGCSHTSTLEKVHINLIEGGHEKHICICNSLIDMYGKCGNLEDANVLFLRMPSRNIVTWTALIAGYSQYGHAQEALLLFDKMQNEGLNPNPVTFAALLNACSNKEALRQGRHIHAHVIEYGLDFDAYIGSSLIDMYFKCFCPDDALEVFNRLPEKGVVTWNTLITGYVQHAKCLEAWQCYQHMLSEGIVQPDSVTYICILKSCLNTTALKQGIWIHANIISSDFLIDTCIGSGLIEMYIKCGYLEDACRVFSSLPKRSVVTWNILLKGFTETGHGNKTLELFLLMQEDGLKPDTVTLLCTIKACSSIAALQQGHLIHTRSTKWGLDMDLSVGNSLINMYSSCGSMSEAQGVFDELPMQDGVSWSALMAGYAQHNDYLEALRCFKSMQECDHKPDEVTLVCLLSACCRGGLIDEGFLHFEYMRDSLGLQPTVEHYNPLVDLLGGVGALHEAEDLLETLPFQKNMVGWVALLASCRKHSNQDIGRRCFDRVVEIDPANAAAYVIMSNIYARASLLKEAQNVEELRRLANAWKKPAKAFIEIDSQVHEFMVGDQTHPQNDAIRTKLRGLNTQLKKEGHRPHFDLVFNFSDEEDKEMALCGHSEKLAIAFGLISSSPATTLRVSKNLRMCADCHAVTKAISKIETRDIIVKDAYCIHQFREGLCSCER